MKIITKKAYAKINLALDVVGVQENGYHLVKMIMQTVDLHDELKISLEEAADVREIIVRTDHAELPTDDSNLIYKAAIRFMERYELFGKVTVDLQKHIPIAAGMAGGSTDAAATLLGLNALYDLQISKKELCDIGVKIGADVPYCIMGGTMLAEGIGEILSDIPAPPKATLLIAKPEFGVSTQYVYRQLDKEGIDKHPDVDGMIQSMKEKDLEGICKKLGNVLENVTEKENPQIKELKDMMMEFGAMGSLMSGSGPTVFGIFEHLEQAEIAFAAIRESGLAKDVMISSFYNETAENR